MEGAAVVGVGVVGVGGSGVGHGMSMTLVVVPVKVKEVVWPLMTWVTTQLTLLQALSSEILAPFVTVRVYVSPMIVSVIVTPRREGQGSDMLSLLVMVRE